MRRKVLCPCYVLIDAMVTNYAKTLHVVNLAGTNVTDALKALVLPDGGSVLADGVHGTLMQGSRG